MLTILFCIISSEAIKITAYNYNLLKFYNKPLYSLLKDGVSLNGKFNSNIGETISSLDLLALTPIEGGSSVDEMCPNVSSKKGHTTLSYVGSNGICCWASESQTFIPYTEDKENRYYLCGSWPHLDEVTVPLSETKIRFGITQKLKDIPIQ